MMCRTVLNWNVTGNMISYSFVRECARLRVSVYLDLLACALEDNTTISTRLCAGRAYYIDTS